MIGQLMKPVCSATAACGVAILCALGGAGQRQLQAASSMSAEDVIQKAVERSQRRQVKGQQPAYTYTQVSITEAFDSKGKVKERKEKVSQVYFKDGVTHVKLLEVNGRAPAGADLKKQAEDEKDVREMTGKSKSDRKDDRENFLTP